MGNVDRIELVIAHRRPLWLEPPLLFDLDGPAVEEVVIVRTEADHVVRRLWTQVRLAQGTNVGRLCVAAARDLERHPADLAAKTVIQLASRGSLGRGPHPCLEVPAP